jgi:cytochrome c
MNRILVALFCVFIGYFPIAFSAESESEALDDAGIEKLMRVGSCWGCHAIDEMRIGPSYRMIAARYRKPDDHRISILTEKVKNGGFGNWGVVPMVSNTQLSDKELGVLINWILRQK